MLVVYAPQELILVPGQRSPRNRLAEQQNLQYILRELFLQQDLATGMVREYSSGEGHSRALASRSCFALIDVQTGEGSGVNHIRALCINPDASRLIRAIINGGGCCCALQRC